ncbi:MAG: hypothetical protein PGN23_16540 [Sphingomonas adhaesiva]|uniref:hypothetical protein n=1 Tax=Sphingomonas adhaesiva TaxID=28212 RepID=UPI002FFA96AE
MPTGVAIANQKLPGPAHDIAFFARTGPIPRATQRAILARHRTIVPETPQEAAIAPSGAAAMTSVMPPSIAVCRRAMR